MLALVPQLEILDGHRIVASHRKKKLKRLRSRDGEEEAEGAPKRIRDVKEKQGHRRYVRPGVASRRRLATDPTGGRVADSEACSRWDVREVA